eukprot:3189131-Karenia_brevis.AAC.1
MPEAQGAIPPHGSWPVACTGPTCEGGGGKISHKFKLYSAPTQHHHIPFFLSNINRPKRQRPGQGLLGCMPLFAISITKSDMAVP